MRSTWAAFTTLLVLLSCPSLLGDWVDLTSGVSLRGVDYKEQEGFVTFVLEDGKPIRLAKGMVASHRKSAPDEKVEFRGGEVTLREKVRILREEAARRRKESLRDLEAWARGSGEAAAAEARLRALPVEERHACLSAALLDKSKGKEVKVLAARELAAPDLDDRAADRVRRLLAHGAVSDPQEPVRTACLGSLKTLGDPGAADRFIPYLESPSSDQRIGAMRALEELPSVKAIPILLGSARLTWSGGGRSFFFQGEERAYVADYELISGGTGFSIVEVADPVISKVTTGVVLDVKVRRVEMEARIRTLRKIVGRDFGPEIERWRDWWRTSPERTASRNPGKAGD